jgi:hypothetical protein
MTSSKHFHLIVPVWGKAFTSLFTDICLPMLMTPGNLYALGKQPRDRFVIATTWEDRLSIQATESFKRLQSIMNVHFILVDGLVNFAITHDAMSGCYAMAMKDKTVIPGETYFVFLTPDSFWPDGTFQRLGELVDQDFKVVMAGGLRVKSEAMSAILRQRIHRSPENPAVPLTELIHLALANLHQLSDAFNILSRTGFLNIWPSHIYWINNRDNQLVAHCFHLHPLLVLAPNSEVSIGTTIDGDFIDNLRYPLNQFHVIQEDFVAIELTPSARNWGQPLSPPLIRDIVRFSLRHANRRHWYFFGKRILLNGNPETPIDPDLTSLVDEFVRRLSKYKRRALIINIFALNRIITAVEYRMSQAKRLLGRRVYP